MIERAKRILKNAIMGVVTKEVEKAAGTHIFRPLFNAEEWAAWAVAAGVPEPKGADELKVSILNITAPFQLIPNDDAQVIRTEACIFGVYNGKLGVLWYDYGYYDRHWTLREIAGYDCCCTSRAMLVLSDAPGDFVFSDEALRSVPRNIALNGEQSEPVTGDTVDLMKSAPVAHQVPFDGVKLKAKQALLTASMDENSDPLVLARLFEISKGYPMNVNAAIEELGAEFAAKIGMTDIPAVDVRKTAEVTQGREVKVLKRDAERQTIYAWASVSTVDGELYTDLHGDTISVEALHDACTLIVKSGQNLGGVEHGETPNYISAAMVLDNDFAAGISPYVELGDDGVLKMKQEGLVIGYHIPDKSSWDENKDLPLEFSINATAFVDDKESV